MIRFLYVLLGIYCCAFFGIIFLFFSKIPNRNELNSCFTTSMFQLLLCPESKEYVKLNQISDNLKKAIIISEDAAFYTHKGFDWVSIKSNLEKNIQHKKIIRGGSTITQQLVKNLFFNAEKSVSRKILEMVYTAKVEHELSKSEIFEKYLNVIELGDNIFGVNKASQFYFGKEPSNLSLVESAFLAMLLPNPKKYASSFYKKSLTEFAHLRITKILNDLYSMGKISETEFNTSSNELKTFLNGYHGNTDKIDNTENDDSVELSL